jgi:cyclopropane-fatty-acyl-phospholipid synthase
MKKTLQQLLQTLSENTPDLAFEVRFWDGENQRFGSGAPAFYLIFKNQQAAKRIFQSGSLGFGEEYMAGNIVAEGDFQQLMRLGASPSFRHLKFSARTKLAILLRAIFSRNTLSRSPRNVSHHYDRGNDFYRLWLDESMAYSCAYFRDETDSLEQAQQQKYEHLCRKLQLKAGETLVDIGCGWGGMLIYAARHYGVKGVGCTLSKPQVEYARERIKREKLENKIVVLLQDYRTLSGQFDKLVSLGMFEHVGKKYIPAFMKKTSELLKPEGIGVLHTIGKERPSRGDPWTLKYIFPGGYIPVLDEIVRAMGDKGLVPTDIENLRLHYAMTLNEWSKRFEANAEKIEAMYDKPFIRMWRMFLDGSAASFRYGDLRLYQIAFTSGINNTLPLTREHLYEMEKAYLELFHNQPKTS